MALLRMDNAIQRYDWGSSTALPELLGLENRSGKPIAEVWMGAHPRGASKLLLPGGEAPLNELIKAEPGTWLGGAVAERFHREFPFLLKLLSAEKGLSIQVHPSKAQAEEGYEREDRLGIPVDAPHRNYRDRNHKPEMLLALTPFYALSGFRESRQIEGYLAPLVHQVGGAATELPLPGRAGLEAWFRHWMKLPAEEKSALISTALERAPEEDRRDPLWWVAELHRQFPGDFGVLSPLFLELLELRPGEAIFLGPGELHAYLRGTGVEIMANSDNVLRSGCTGKHVDTEELLEVLNFDPKGALRVEPFGLGAGIERFRTPAEEFELYRVTVDGTSRTLRRNATVTPPVIILAVSGALEVTAEEPESTPLNPGESVYVTPGTATIQFRGSGIAYCAAPAGGIEA